MLAFGNFSFWEIALLLGVLLLLFGSSRLPKMARSLGQSLTEFKRGLKEPADDDEPKKVEGDGGEERTKAPDVKSTEDAKSSE